jgi:hypothetical protein
METETTPPASGRPRPLLLILLGIAVLALAVVKLLPSGSTTAPRPTSNQPGSAATTGAAAPLDPKDLDVRLEALEATRPEPSDESRNPFGFAPKPEPSPPPREVVPPPQPSGPENAEPSGPPPGPAPPPPIPLKYLGIIEGQGKKLAALSDCKFTYRGEEGEIVDGRYRLVKIQVESVIMEYVDGRGRTTIRLSGQDCVGR